MVLCSDEKKMLYDINSSELQINTVEKVTFNTPEELFSVLTNSEKIGLKSACRDIGTYNSWAKTYSGSDLKLERFEDGSMKKVVFENGKVFTFNPWEMYFKESLNSFPNSENKKSVPSDSPTDIPEEGSLSKKTEREQRVQKDKVFQENREKLVQQEKEELHRLTERLKWGEEVLHGDLKVISHNRKLDFFEKIGKDKYCLGHIEQKWWGVEKYEGNMKKLLCGIGDLFDTWALMKASTARLTPETKEYLVDLVATVIRQTIENETPPHRDETISFEESGNYLQVAITGLFPSERNQRMSHLQACVFPKPTNAIVKEIMSYFKKTDWYFVDVTT